MKEAGVVSIWFGSAPSEDKLFQALEVAFSEDGDFLGSPLSNALGIGRYEDSTREALYNPPGKYALRTFLEGASYLETFIEKLDQSCAPTRHDTCALLLYNYRYDRRIQASEALGVSMRFIASVPYRLLDPTDVDDFT